MHACMYLGLAILKFRLLCEIYLLHFHTGINVGLYFADSFPSTFIVYRRTHIKTFKDKNYVLLSYLQVTAARGCKMSHLRCSNHMITVWVCVYWLLASSRVAK